MIDTIVNSFDIWTDAQGIKSRTRVKSVDNISLVGLEGLRQLILELAVMGKLVNQDPNDEPASELLKRIEKEKERLIEEGKIRKQSPLVKITDNECPFALSAGWEFCRLDALCSLITKGSSPKWQGVSYTENPNDVLFITSENVGSYQLLLDSKKYVELKFNEVEPKSILEKGDFLMNIVGGSIGRTAIYNIDNLANINQAVCLIRMFSQYLDEQFFLHFFNSSICVSYMFDKQVENARANLSMGNISKFVLPLPPLTEQKRIVAKVDELMALCDKLEEEQFNSLKTHQLLVNTLLETLTQAADGNELQAAWERMSTHFDTLFCTEDSIGQLKQTILQLAIMGKLVKQDSNDEPASELIKKIVKEKNKLIEEGKLKKTAPLAEISENEKMFLLPKGWEWKRLNDIIDVRDGTHDSPKEAFGDTTFPLVTSQNFENGRINFDTAKRISEEDHIEISKRSLVERYDILFSMIGGNLGNQVMVNTDRSFSVKNVALFKYYSRDCTSPYYIKKIMEYIALTLQSKAIGGAQPFVSLGFLRNIVIALPPIEEQKRIVEKINELFALSESLKEKVQKSHYTKVLLSKTIIEKAVQ